MSRVTVLLAEGFEEVEALTAIDFLRRAGAELLVTGIGTLAVTGAHGVTVKSDVLIEDLDTNFDAVVLPGGMPGAKNLAASKEVENLCKSVHKKGGLIAAICAAPAVVLDSFGLIEGRHFTCYPGFEKQVSGGIFSSDRVVRDGNLITSRGPGTAAEFAIDLIDYLVGKGEANRISDDILLCRP